MKLSGIKLNPNNPQIIKDDRFKELVKSISEFPKMMKLRPIIVDSKNMILGGNKRYNALKELGYKEIPDEWVKCADELTEEEKKRFIIVDNVGFGEWDWDILAQNWSDVDLASWGVDIKFEDMTQKDMDSKYNNQNCEYPLIPIYDEKYTAFIIICETKTQEASIRTKFNFPIKAKSYKNKFLGQTNVIKAKDILNDTDSDSILQESR